MNNLSWLLYWADVLPSFAATITFLCVLSMLGSALITLCYIIVREEFFIPLPIRWIVPIVALVISLTSFIPSKQTIYLIAASEMGGQAINTPEFLKVRKVVNQYLDDALKPEKKEESE